MDKYNKKPLLFNGESRPIMDQIIEMMEHLGHDEKSINKVKEEFKKGNIDYVTNMAQVLAMQFVGNSIFEAIDEDDKLTESN